MFVYIEEERIKLCGERLLRWWNWNRKSWASSRDVALIHIILRYVWLETLYRAWCFNIHWWQLHIKSEYTHISMGHIIACYVLHYGGTWLFAQPKVSSLGRLVMASLLAMKTDSKRFVWAKISIIYMYICGCEWSELCDLF